MNYTVKLKSDNRYDWIDVAKGISILLVMWGHIATIHDVFYEWVVSFHVPVFLVITGFLFSAQHKKKETFNKTARKILRPYLFFSFISIITDSSYSYLMGGGTSCNKGGCCRLL